MLFASLFLCFFLLLALTTVCMATSEDEAASKIIKAEDGVRQAFQVVLEAEKAGANISGLMERLNEVGGLLREAKMAYGNKDLDAAVSKADYCSVLANSVLDDAWTLTSSALVNSQGVIHLTFVAALVGAVVFVFVLIRGWYWFKRLHVKKLLKMKPEVPSNVKA